MVAYNLGPFRVITEYRWKSGFVISLGFVSNSSKPEGGAFVHDEFIEFVDPPVGKFGPRAIIYNDPNCLWELPGGETEPAKLFGKHVIAGSMTAPYFGSLDTINVNKIISAFPKAADGQTPRSFIEFDFWYSGGTTCQGVLRLEVYEKQKYAAMLTHFNEIYGLFSGEPFPSYAGSWATFQYRRGDMKGRTMSLETLVDLSGKTGANPATLHWKRFRIHFPLSALPDGTRAITVTSMSGVSAPET